MQVLERPSVVEPAIIATLSKSPNNSLNRSSILPALWDKSVADQYVHQSIDTFGWNYARNFRTLNAYERWTYTCSCCEGPISQCKNNETLGFKAAQWAEWYKNNTMSNATLEQPAAVAPAQEAQEPKSGRRAKGSFAKSVPSNLNAAILAGYATGATIAELATEFLVAPTAVREFLSTKGVLRGRGQGLNRPTVRVRKTSSITPEVIAAAMISFPEIGVVATAKNLNVSAVELSAALKEAGAVIQRGRRATKA